MINNRAESRKIAYNTMLDVPGGILRIVLRAQTLKKYLWGFPGRGHGLRIQSYQNHLMLGMQHHQMANFPILEYLAAILVILDVIYYPVDKWSIWCIRIIHNYAILAVLLGIPVHVNCGDLSLPSHVYSAGIVECIRDDCNVVHIFIL